MRATILAMAVLLTALAACGTDQPPPAGQDDPAMVDDGEPGGTDDAGDDSSEAVPASQAVAQAAEDLGVDPSAIEIVTAELVTWPDGSLGCPEPDGMYTQALVDGYRIVLDVDGEAVHYHGAHGEPPFRCDDPQEPAETAG